MDLGWLPRGVWQIKLLVSILKYNFVHVFFSFIGNMAYFHTNYAMTSDSPVAVIVDDDEYFGVYYVGRFPLRPRWPLWPLLGRSVGFHEGCNVKTPNNHNGTVMDGNTAIETPIHGFIQRMDAADWFWTHSNPQHPWRMDQRLVTVKGSETIWPKAFSEDSLIQRMASVNWFRTHANP